MAFREVGNMLNEANKSNINANDKEALEGISSLNGKFSNYYTKNELDQKLKENGGKSAYEIAVENGFIGTEQEWLDSFEVIEGKSAYQVWLDAGNTGTEDDFLNSQAEKVVPFVLHKTQEYTDTQLEAMLIRATDFGAKGDGVADDTLALQNAINQVATAKVGSVFLNGSTFNISATLNVPSNVEVYGYGSNSTKIVTLDNTFDAFNIIKDGRRTQIRDMTIYSKMGIGTNNVGIRTDLINGGAEQTYSDLVISNFKYGFYAGNIWWCNTLMNVRINNCDINFFIDGGTGGQSINNLFIRCYSNKPNARGWWCKSLKNCTWLTCNFGGLENTANEFIRFESNCLSMKLIGCNFEHAFFADNTAGIVTWSGSEVSLDGCVFASNALVSGATKAYEISARDTSVVKVDNCSKLNQGSGIIDFYSQNDAQLIFDNCPKMTTKQSYSTKPMIDVSASVANSSKAKGSGSYISGNAIPVTVAPTQVIITVDTSYTNFQNVIAYATEYGSTYFKVAFFDRTTGNPIYNTSIPIKYVVF